MLKDGFVKLLSYVSLVSFATLVSSCNDATTPPGELAPENITEVIDIQLAVLESDPLQLNITAKGNVSSSGWTNPELVPFVYVVPPQDGIYDFDFLAIPPEEVSAPVITPIEVTHRLNPLPSNLKGVRIHATQNNKVAMLDAGAAALFEFKGSDANDRFVIKLTEQNKIQHARDLLSGATQDMKSIMGTVVKQTADYNPDWSYHLEPTSITFFDMAIEVCDATMRYVEEHLDEVGGSFLPNNQWCPWGSELTRGIDL
jgi:hypothetical protein